MARKQARIDAAAANPAARRATVTGISRESRAQNHWHYLTPGRHRASSGNIQRSQFLPVPIFLATSETPDKTVAVADDDQGGRVGRKLTDAQTVQRRSVAAPPAMLKLQLPPQPPPKIYAQELADRRARGEDFCPG
jgi:hypothetical protein